MSRRYEAGDRVRYTSPLISTEVLDGTISAVHEGTVETDAGERAAVLYDVALDNGGTVTIVKAHLDKLPDEEPPSE